MTTSGSDLSIRKAVPEDASELLALIRKAMAVYARQSGIDTPLDAELETLEELQAHLSGSHVLVAVSGSRLVGTVRLVPMDQDTALFSRFAVLPDRQRSGVGQMLYQAAEQYLRVHGFQTVMLFTALTNQQLVTFYETRGFVLADTSYERGYPRGLFIKSIAAGQPIG